MKLGSLVQTIRTQANPDKVKIFQWFFKTKIGEYGYGDKFLGLTTPQTRIISKKYFDLSLTDLQTLIRSPYHEERGIALQILVLQFGRFSSSMEIQIFNFYLKNTKYINNWDLVDISAPKIVGAYLSDKPRDILYQLVRSNNLWERRIAIISCFYFIKSRDLTDALRISRILLSDKHDLIHKAVGWMLREIGKRDEKVLLNFIKANYPKIPRTTLRYAIEKFPQAQRQKLLTGDI